MSNRSKHAQMPIFFNMRRSIICILMSSIAIVAYSQNGNNKIDDFLRAKQAKIDSFNVEKDKKVKSFRDSLNDVYADFLAQQWQKVQLFINNENFDPMPEPPIYDEEPPVIEPLPPSDEPTPYPEPDITPLPLPDPKPMPTEPKPAPIPDKKPVSVPSKPKTPSPYEFPKPNVNPPSQIDPIKVPTRDGVDFDFYSERFLLPSLNSQVTSLKDPTEKSISIFWKELSALDLDMIVGTLTQLSEELELDAWGMHVLVSKMIDVYFPEFSENEKAIAQVFLLNQLGYKAKIASSGDHLFVTLSMKTKLSNTCYFTYNNEDKYYVLNPQHLQYTEMRSCMADYSKDNKAFDLQLHKLPKLDGDITDYAAFLSTYPCMEFNIYAEAPLSEPMKEYISDNLEPQLTGLTPLEGIDKLLKIVSNHPYKTDKENYGYEKWNFAEESVIEPYTDCDDNAILLAQLAKYLYGLDVVLLHYQNVHLATAIHFPDEDVKGDSITYNGKTYIVCDPTYRNANVGMEMKSSNIKSAKLNIIPVNS